jgi:hypothetical protein
LSFLKQRLGAKVELFVQTGNNEWLVLVERHLNAGEQDLNRLVPTVCTASCV